jgi:predicted neuraminidase
MNESMAKRARGLPLLLVAVSLLINWQHQLPALDWRIKIAPLSPSTTAAKPEFHSDFASSSTDLFVHAASVTALEDGRLLSAWFAGSREGAADVKIYGAYYQPQTAQWSRQQVLASRESTRRALGRSIRKLGNPVVSQAPDGKLWLFYVSVSVGGWAGSAINASHSNDGGLSWSPPVRLITSPFTNISTLVKAAPIYYQDGSIGLPVYHEFLGKFAELLRLDQRGRVMDKARISHGKDSLQPVVIAASPDDATALMRYAGAAPKRLLLSRSSDGGKSWPIPQRSSLPNPNSAVSALRLRDGSILGVMNDLEDGRHRLSLMQSRDEGEHWQLLTHLEGNAQSRGHLLPRQTYRTLLQEQFFASAGSDAAGRWQRYSEQLDERVCDENLCRFVYDYPFMIEDQHHEFHLVYSWNKSFIKHLRFNQAWLDSL